MPGVVDQAARALFCCAGLLHFLLTATIDAMASLPMLLVWLIILLSRGLHLFLCFFSATSFLQASHVVSQSSPDLCFGNLPELHLTA